MLHQNFVAVDGLAPTLGDSVQTMSEGNAPYDQRGATNPNANKHVIALAAAGLIPGGNSIAISVGTAPMTVADTDDVAVSLADNKSLTFITNNLDATMSLSRETSNRSIQPGGEARLSDPDIPGDQVVEFFGNYLTESGIFGIGSVISNSEQVILDIKPQNDFAELLDGLRERLKLTGGAL